MILPYKSPVTSIESSMCRVLPLFSSSPNDYYSLEDDEEELFLQSELEELGSLDDLFLDELDEKTNLEELLQLLADDDDDSSQEIQNNKHSNMPQERGFQFLEQALLQGVVPVSAGVGDDQLPGDYGFDPLNWSTRDTIGHVQRFLWGRPMTTTTTTTRPAALILRDYREAEIRHGRLAMLAAVFWPLQEMLDRLLLDDIARPLFQTSVTLPYFPLLMTGIMLLLGYLDIYSQAVKDLQTGEAFLPADCFWDPLSVLEGGSDRMKRNMQERELLVRKNSTSVLCEVCHFYIVSHSLEL